MDTDSNNENIPVDIEQSQNNLDTVNDANSNEAQGKQPVILNGVPVSDSSKFIVDNAKSNQATIIIFISIFAVSFFTFGIFVFQNSVNTKNQSAPHSYIEEEDTDVDPPVLKQDSPTPTSTTEETVIKASDTNPTGSSCQVSYDLQPTECKGYSIANHGLVNSNWKKYTINKYNISFDYPSTLQDYRLNRGESFVLYNAVVDNKNANIDATSLNSSVDVILQTKPSFRGEYELVNLKTGIGDVSAKYSVVQKDNNGRFMYTYEFKVDDIYYNYQLFNSSEKLKIMTADEFKQLVESTAKVN